MEFFDLPTHLPNANIGDDNKTPAVEPITKVPPPPVPRPKSPEPEQSDIDEELLTIQGTNIKLETEEDIQKWIEDRKKNWPSKQNIERKKEEPPAKKPKMVCKFYQKNKSCKYGSKCKNLHEDNSVPSRFEYKNEQSLFKMLVKNDQVHENNKFIKFLRYVDKQGVMRGSDERKLGDEVGERVR